MDDAEASVELAAEIHRVCAGKPNAVVYLAISQVLGFMETLARKEPRRQELFKLISDTMDDYIRSVAN